MMEAIKTKGPVQTMAAMATFLYTDWRTQDGEEEAIYQDFSHTVQETDQDIVIKRDF